MNKYAEEVIQAEAEVEVVVLGAEFEAEVDTVPDFQVV